MKKGKIKTNNINPEQVFGKDAEPHDNQSADCFLSRRLRSSCQILTSIKCTETHKEKRWEAF